MRINFGKAITINIEAKTMNKLNYTIHIILNSNYYLVYKILILLFIYILIYNKDIIFCMNENNNNSNDLPTVAESKPSHQVLALKNEIVSYAKEHIMLAEQVAEQKETIDTLTVELERKQLEIKTLTRELYCAKCTMSDLKYTISVHEEVVKNMQKELKDNKEIIAGLKNI